MNQIVILEAVVCQLKFQRLCKYKNKLFLEFPQQTESNTEESQGINVAVRYFYIGLFFYIVILAAPLIVWYMQEKQPQGNQ